MATTPSRRRAERLWWLFGLGAAAALLGIVALGRGGPAAGGRGHGEKRGGGPGATPAPDTRPFVDAVLRGTPAWPEDRALRWLAIGGGEWPGNNQVAIEQDLALAATTFGSDGALLFAGGPGSHGVLVQDGPPQPPETTAATTAHEAQTAAVRARLAALFLPRPERGGRYRRTTLPAADAATRRKALDWLERALVSAPSDRSLLRLYLAGHGEIGATQRDNSFRLWGGDMLTVAELGTLLDAAPPARPVQLIATSCFSGGFAEIAFHDTDLQQGAAQTVRCGLFASTWDLESSGCDPNPDRRAQDGFGLHFLQALRGLDKAGRPLPAAALDFDGDGRVSPLEAHARARIASRSLDVPTTTSERWLRVAAPSSGPTAKVQLPEDEAVIAALAAALELKAPTAKAVRWVFDDLEAQLQARDGHIRALQTEEALARAELQAALLARWPWLDDPWGAGFETSLGRHSAAIARWLGETPAAARLDALGESLDVALLGREPLLLRAARVERLLRAQENLARAGRLVAAGGEALTRWQLLLSCERLPLREHEGRLPTP